MEIKLDNEDKNNLEVSGELQGVPDLFITHKIIQKLKRDSSFERVEKKIEEEFYADHQLACFSDLSDIDSKKVFVEAGKFKNASIIFIFGYRFPSDKKLMEKLYLSFIKLIESKEKEEYILVYFNAGVPYFQTRQISFVRKCYKQLPVRFLINLKQIYVCFPTFILRTFVALFTNLNSKKMKAKLTYMKNFKELQKAEFFKEEWVKHIPEEILNFKKKNDEEEKKNPGIFGLNLKDMSRTEAGIPEVIVVLTGYFETNPDAMDQKGLFRVAGAISEVEKMEKALSNFEYDYIYEHPDHNVIGDVIKKLFSKTPEPLFPFESYPQLIESRNSPNQLNCLKEIINKLPNINKNTLCFMLFLLGKIAQHESLNNMTPYNLAVVFTPCFIRPKEFGMEQIAETVHAVGCLKVMIENMEKIFPECETLYCSSVESGKEAKRKASLSQKEKHD